ncbi:type VII secretion protein EccC [Nocardia mangyaensis]|uniref:Type VII secretion protein EccC n=1 Tax=Nocardia mangyaensis TaxID=2213200 RepID=A0A1J0VML9_9NOCA|nr:type VII secretion protein EccCa [Nocardia mangyaensis]APE33273.1 type VII secretion protein EccC [Nocardia mangyaensis]
MTTEGFVRRPRVAPPRVPGGEVALTAPPEIPRNVPTPLITKLMPVVMVVAVIGMIGMMVMMGRDLMRNPFMMMFPLMMIMSMVGMMAGFRGGGGQKRPAELNEDRKDYFRYLDQIRKDVGRTGAEQHAALLWSHPDPGDLLPMVGSRRMWERRPSDIDFGHVRVGVGSHRLATKLARPETGPLEDLEPVSTVALRRFVRTHSVVHQLPTAVSLRAFPAINVEGEHAEARMLVRAMLVELTAFHGPDHVAIAIVCAEPDGPSWSWAKWLPHLQHPDQRDGMGAARMMYDSLAELETALGDELLERGRFMRNPQPTQGRIHLVVVIDDGYVSGTERVISESGLDSVTVLDLTAPEGGLAARRGLQLVAADGEISARSAAGVEKFATADSVTLAEAESLARALARYRIATAAQIVSLGDDVSTADPGLMALLKIPDAARIEPNRVWRPRTARERLRVPIGITPDGSPVEIDIKESAENGMGPHGLCIGATGSGKSEFLRTLVLSLVTTHSPDALNLVLVDFKGGATFLGLDPLPHVAAVITNLEEELSMVDRMKDALAGEMNRRQELLRSAGNFANVNDYEKARAAGAALDPLPALFVVVDEFSELLSQKPDFADLFVMIGRLGRSLHVHLLLASQRLEENKLRGLDSHLSYRIGLRTFSANESRAVLGITDAYHLPSVPGAGYLKSDSADPLRFTATYVSGPYVAPRSAPEVDGRPVDVLPPRVFTAAPVELSEVAGSTVAADDPLGLPPPPPSASAAPAEGVPATLLEVVVDRLIGHGRPAHEVWLPPLDESPSVDMLLPDPDWRSLNNRNGRLWMPVGVVDKPYEQRRDVLTVELSGAQGHVAVVGGPQSGKSTTLRTLIVAAAATHTPEQVQFYCLDFGGGSMAGLVGMPHVGSVAGRLDVDRVRRTVAELTSLLRRREELFTELGIESMAEFRRRKEQSGGGEGDPLAEDRFGDVFLVIDGWAVIREEFDSLEPLINAIAKQGLSFGIHLMLGASRWAEIRPVVKDQIGTRLELRLGDPSDSEMGRRTAGSVPMGRPGRGLTPDQLQMLIALPRLDSDSDSDTLADGVATARKQLTELYGTRRAPEVRMLPLQFSREELLAQAAATGIVEDAKHVVIGLGESELTPLVLDFEAQPHFMAFADVGCGKTTLLRNIVQGIADRTTAEQARFILVDYRRTMLGVLEGDQLAGYSTSAQTCGPMMKEVAAFLAKRLPPADVTPQQLRERSWWTGSEIYVVVDDYDMVMTGGAVNSPFAPLVEYLPQARDLGFHFVAARRMGGAGRALMDNVMGGMKNLSVDALVMSGSRDEGKLFGNLRPSKLPPGRGTLVSRALGEEMIQIAHLPEL